MSEKVITLDDLIAPNYDELLEDVIDHRHTHYILSGGRGSLKSSFASLCIPLLMTMKENSKVHAVVFRKTASTLRDSVYAQLEFAISMLGMEEHFTFTVSPMKITYKPTGQTIMFRGVDDKMKLKSLKAPFGYIGIAWLEECDTFNGIEEIRNILQSAMRGGPRYWVFWCFNPPRSKTNFMNRECEKPSYPNAIVHKSDYRSVPVEWLGEEFFATAERLKETNEDAYNHEYLGQAVGTGGEIFDNVWGTRITDEEIRNFEWLYNGLDFGWFPDPNAFTRSSYDSKRRILYVFDEMKSNKNTNLEIATELVNRHGLKPTDEVICDSAEPKSIADLRAYGILARATEKGQGSVNYSMKWLQGLTKIVIDPVRCPNTYKEFTEYEYPRDKEGEIMMVYPDKKNHFIDSVRYATNRLWKTKGM